MKSSSRELFLKQHWQAYPAMPKGDYIAGRVLSVNEKSLILANGDLYAIAENCALGPVLSGFSLGKPSEILSPGDLICFLSGDFDSGLMQISLLAPRKTQAIRGFSDPSIPGQWADFNSQIRSFFVDQGFLEAQTPTLVVCPGTEPYLNAFSVELAVGRARTKLYLPTSPELHLKKMLAMDLGPLFEIKSCFRNGEITQHHQPEFTMLEWYRPYSDLESIREDLKNLAQQLRQEDIEFVQLSMSDLFERFANAKISPESSLKDYQKMARDLKIHTTESDSITELFHRIFLEKIEPKLKEMGPIIVDDFPPFQAAYARLTEEGWADRFEFYWNGLEIANAFHEVNDPDLQVKRMQEDLEFKKQMGREVFPLDEEFIQALKAGMPPSGGIALGMERLFMAVSDVEQIQQLKLFPYLQV